LRKCSHNVLNHSKWSTYDEDVNKCLIIGRQSVKRRSTLDPQNTGKTSRKFEAFLPLFYFNVNYQSQTFPKLFLKGLVISPFVGWLLFHMWNSCVLPLPSHWGLLALHGCFDVWRLGIDWLTDSLYTPHTFCFFFWCVICHWLWQKRFSYGQAST